MRPMLFWSAALLLLGGLPVAADELPLAPCEAARSGVPEGEGEFERPASPRLVEFSAGIKAGAGVDVWTAPSDTILYVNPTTNKSFTMPIFDNLRAGYNVAFGLAAEARFLQYVGLEIDLMFVRHKLWEHTDWTYNGALSQTRQTLVFTKLNLPILFKGYLPLGRRVRLSLGIGPEFAWALYSRATLGLISAKPPGGDYEKFKTLKARSVDDVNLVTSAGLMVDLGVVKVPIEFRFAYNFSQPGKYTDRVIYAPLPPIDFPKQATLRARDSMYAQLLLGLMYDL